ncbi:hypothetical protein [Saccharothrix texasensis]|uniref:hypothetical protein n=1 Tax=Saccharothrix texasensis TaxID=103734 RepID=UPI001FE5195B|nr:hypothetical protein [Saccharothrix texasensis]
MASLLTDDLTARAIQPAIEYDPEPPFAAGDAVRADPGLGELAMRLIAESQV